MTQMNSILSLLQVVALMIPAVAIYMEIVSSRHDLNDMNDGEAANYHAIRLTILLLLFSGLVLLLALSLNSISPILSTAFFGTALFVLALALVTFVLPVAFSIVGLTDSRGILWPYRNLLHRITDSLK